MKTIIFTGPSLSRQAGREIVENGIFLPPLRQADLITAITRHQPDVIVIFDDYSGLSEAVWHSEILEATNCGIKVYGAAAIGAVRAFEMDHCGMIGVGRVYQMFKDGIVEDDDEVLALSRKLENGDFSRLSEPLVNLRATFAKAVECGVIDQKNAQEILAIAKGLPWSERSIDNIFSSVGDLNMPVSVSEKILNFVTTEYQDVQKEDALLTLERVKELEEDFCRSNTAVVPRNYDNPLWILYERDRKIESDAGDMTLHDLAAHVVFDHPRSEELNRAALNRELAAFLAGFLGLTVTAEDVDRERAWFMTKHQLTDDGTLSIWLKDNDLTKEEFADMLRELASGTVCRKWFLARKKYQRMTKTILDELRIRGEYKVWKKRGVERAELLKGKDEELLKLAEKQDLQSSLARKRLSDDLPWQVDPLAGAGMSGFTPATLHLELVKEQIVQDEFTARAAALFSQKQ